MTDKLLTAADVMEIMGCGKDSAIAMMRQMRHINISNGKYKQYLRVRERDLNAWLDSRTKNPPAKPKKVRKTESEKPAVIGEIGNPYFMPYIHPDRKEA